MINKKIKSNKGITGADIVIAIIIVIILGGTVATMFYNVYYNTVMIRANALAIYYATTILEDTDAMKYEKVTEDINNNLKEEYGILDNFDVSLKVEKYSDKNAEAMDIIKILTLNIKYSIMNNEPEELTIKKLKVKEI